jgi:hypothetical protein
MVGKLPGGQRLSPLGRVLVAFAVLVLLFVVALATRPWGFILLGFGIGLLVAFGVKAAQAGVRPVEALGRAALPLLLPLFAFAAAGVVKSPAGLQFAVGLATLLVAWTWLIQPEWDVIREILRRTRRTRTGARAVVQVGLPLALLTVALAVVVFSIFGVLGDSDDTARTLFILAVGSLTAAAVLRLVSYGSTFFRALVALALLVLLARFAMKLGVVAEKGVLADVAPSTLAIIATALLGVTAAVEIVTALLVSTSPLVAEAVAADETGEPVEAGDPSEQLQAGIRTAAFIETPVTARWIIERAAVAGIALSLLSALLLLFAVFEASTAGGAKEDLGGLTKAGQPQTPPSELGDDELAAMFSPVLLFTADQRWTPIAVDDYVRRASVTDWEQRKTTVQSVDELDTRCPGVVEAPCYVMKQRCPPKTGEARCAENLADEKAVYVRVARKREWAGCERTKPCADGSPDPFAAAEGRYAESTTILVQYWYFYPYNEWVAPVAIGNLKEVHPADWEAVTVGMSDAEPLWVAYSAHCGGTFADWGKIRVAESDPLRLRPLVAVAYGSQANYRVAEANRVPNFAECARIPKDRITLVSYAANIRDRTDDATVWDPSPAALKMVDATIAPMSFPGEWSAYARMTLENLRKQHRLGKDTAGPRTPTFQRLWQRPMRAIFGGGAWKED